MSSGAIQRQSGISPSWPSIMQSRFLSKYSSVAIAILTLFPAHHFVMNDTIKSSHRESKSFLVFLSNIFCIVSVVSKNNF